MSPHDRPRPTLEVPSLSENAMTVLRRRYLARDEAGKVRETPDRLFWRVAHNVAAVEGRYPGGSRPSLVTGHEPLDVGMATAWYRLMSELDFLPNSPTLMNAGRRLQQLSACFVLPVEDSLDGIFSTLHHQALIHQSGGGTGFAFSRLRPKNDRIASTGGLASGPVSFMRIFNTATEVIKQGGTRRGANMGVLRVDHPDILEFIAVKEDLREMTNFNVSVGVTDAFMEAVEAGREYALVNPRSGAEVRRLPAQEVFDRIVDAAWKTGDPGLLFLDTINRDNPTPEAGAIEATNPCGEQPLLPYESCILGSLNLGRFVAGPPHAPRVDYDRLAQVIPLAVRFLDNVVDANRYPLDDVAAVTTANRKIGLGVMGFADLLIKLGVPYDTDEALALGDRLMAFVKRHADAASRALGEERGPFPNWARSRHAADGRPLRNATVTTIAPTGTLSIIADCSAGIEPLYGVSYTRLALDDEELTSLHPEFRARAEQTGILGEGLMRRLGANASIQGLTEIPRELRRLFVTAHDVPPERHVRVQAAFQKHSDSGVSKTINLPHEAGRDDVAKAYGLAYRLGCKGITVFRAGSRGHQVLSCGGIEGCGIALD